MGKVGVVISNLGTPQAPTAKAVGDYLAEFLMDPFVIQIPVVVRFLLVRGIIVPFRKAKSAKNYQKVWQKEGSPLLVETQKVAKALQVQLGNDFQVEVAMRYGSPSFEQAADKLKDCEKIIFFPQYPQFADSTVQTSLVHAERFFPEHKTVMMPPYYQNPDFIAAYVGFLKEKLASVDYDHLLMSFHGLPETHIFRKDPSGSHCLKASNCCESATGQILENCYRAQCYRSAQKLATGLDLDDTAYSVSFQSRLGRQKWIEPYTEDMYKELVSKGVKKLAVICPGFSVDGLETLEEIAMEGKEIFLEQGGEAFDFIPCLNDSPPWIDACAEMVRKIMIEEKEI